MNNKCYNGTSPVYRTFNSIPEKKSAYLLWEDIEPDQSIIKLKKKILFNNETDIRYFISINTRKYAVFDDKYIYIIDRWLLNKDMVKSHIFITDIQPIYFNSMFLGWHDHEWVLYSDDIYHTSCLDIEPKFMVHIHSTSCVVVFTEDFIYKIEIELKSVSSADLISSDAALHAISRNEKLVYSTTEKIIIYDTLTWTIDRVFNVHTDYFDYYDDEIWAISNENLWYSKEKWFKLPVWHSPTKIKIVEADYLITQDNEHIVIWAYTHKHKIPSHYIHSSGSLYINHVIPFHHVDIHYNIFNKEIFYIKHGNVLCSNLSLDQPSFIWPDKIIDWINGKDVDLEKNMLSETALSVLKKTIPIWFGRILEKYESNKNAWKPSVENMSDIMYLSVNYDHISDEIETYVEKYMYTLYDSKEIDQFNLKFIIDLLYSIRMEHLFQYDNFHKHLNLPKTEFEFMFLNMVIQRDDYDEFCTPEYLECYNKNMCLSPVQHLFIKIQYNIKNMDSFMDNQYIIGIIDVDIIRRTSETNMVNKWLKLFKKTTANNDIIYQYYPTHLDNIFKTLVQYVCNIDNIRMYYYPNDNDGIWESNKFTDIRQKDWVLVNNVIFRASQLKTTQTAEILTWVQHSDSGPNNSLERALMILDKDNWSQKTLMVSYDNQFIPIGHSVCSPENSHGIVIDFKHSVLMDDGTKRKIDRYWKIEAHKWQYHIDIATRYKAENWIQDMVHKQGDINIPKPLRSSLLKCLRPKVFNIECAWDHITGMTVINMDKYKNLWIGFRSGLITMLTNGDLMNNNNTYKGHWKDVHSIHFHKHYFVSASSDRTIRIWDSISNKCINILKGHSYGVEKAYFLDNTYVLSIDKTQTIKKWVWKTNTCCFSMHLKGYNYTLHRPVLNMPVTMHMPNAKRALIVSERGLYMYANEKITSCDITSLRISAFTMAKRINLFLVGTTIGDIHVYEIDDIVVELSVLKCSRSPITCIRIINDENYNVLIGDDSGNVYIYNIYSNLCYNRIKICTESITDIVHRSGDEIFIKSGDNKIYYCTFDIERPEKCCSIVKNIIKKSEWRTIFMTKLSVIVKHLFNEITVYGKETEDIYDIISSCIQDHNNRKMWCEKPILDMLLKHIIEDDKHQKVKNIITKLFCFQGKTFKCPLCLGCSSSPRSKPIAFITSCSHRFHKECLMEHIKKLPEWNDDCLHNWALCAELKCPICRIPFTKEHVKDDLFISEVCQYDSGQED
jgi:WD40 repeat protein